MTKASFYIRGWKGLSEYTGYHWKTLQKWHYSRARIPFLRTITQSNRSRWIITPDRVHIWLKMIGVKKEDDGILPEEKE